MPLFFIVGSSAGSKVFPVGQSAIKRKNDMKDNTPSAVFTIDKNKSGIPVKGDILVDEIVNLIVSEPDIALVAVRRIVETEINRVNESNELSWRKLTGENPMDATEWLIARLRGASVHGSRFKGNDDDRKNAAELLDKLTKAGRLEAWEAQNGMKPTIENLTRLFTGIREKAAVEAAKAAKAMLG
jgi:hypothetical protein